MDLISVIVPVYRVEAYLDKCVQSIVDQTYRNLEIILVDDGSPDRCGEICDAWAAKDDRIIVIHTRNQGSGAARNIAINVAQGDLIAFVDGDDYIDSGMFSHLFELLVDDVDIAECDYLTVCDNNAEFDLTDTKIQSLSAYDAMKEHIQGTIFRQVIWNKLYRRHTLDGLCFPVDKKIDDEFFTYRTIGNARKLVHSERKCYAYRQHPNSVMHTISVNKWFAGIEAKALRHEYVLARFPELEGISHRSVIGGCLYLNQLAMRTADPETRSILRRDTAAILKKYPLTGKTFAVMTLKERLWLGMAVVNMPVTCWIRNLLKLGL